MKIKIKEDLTGRTFGRLIVLEQGDAYVSPTGRSRSARWLCRCTCGQLKLIMTSNLKYGRTNSCGCLLRETAKISGAGGVKDLTGQIFGTRRVISRGASNGSPGARWLYECVLCKRTGICFAAMLRRNRRCLCRLLQTSEIFAFLLVQDHYPETRSGTRKELDSGLELDIYVPQLRAAIEINGGVHNWKPVVIANDARKRRICAQKEIALLVIRDWEVLQFPDQTQKKILNFLKNREVEILSEL